MTRTKSVAIAFYLGAALAGAAVGVTTDRLLFHQQTRWWDQHAMRTHLFDQLKLTAEQRSAAELVLEERSRQQDSLMASVRPKLDSAGARARQQLSQLLTPEQRAVYDQMRRSHETEASQRPRGRDAGEPERSRGRDAMESKWRR